MPPPAGGRGQIDHVAIGDAVTVQISDHAPPRFREFLPGLELGHVDSERLHDVGPIREHHGMHVVGHGEHAPARRPHAEPRFDHALPIALALQPVRQVDQAHVRKRSAREVGQGR